MAVSTSPTAALEFKKYLPLVAALGLSLLSSYLLELSRAVNGFVFMHEAMNAFMGCFFVVFAVPKLLDINGFAESFAAYDIIGRRWLKYAKAYPFIELVLGVVLLSNVPTESVVVNQLISVIIILLSGISIYGVVGSLRRGEDVHCACLGSFLKLPLSSVAIVESGLMLLMAVVMLLFYGSLHGMVISLWHMRVVQ